MNKGKNRIFAVLQKIGKSLMLPVSVLPAAGLLVAFGRIIQGMGMTPDGKVANVMLNSLGSIMFKGGIAIFEQLPLVFAIGVAIGFASGEGVAGLAATIGYFVMTNVLNTITELRGLQFQINTGVFGGIIVGLIAANLYKRFYKTKLHPVFGFFEGKRLVPIITALVSLFIGILLGFIWPPIQNGINAFGKGVMDAKFAGFSLSGAIFAAGNRALIPLGLHHVFYAPFLFDFGSFTNAAGQMFRGESARFFAGDPTAGAIMAAEFPLKIFGLPGAALAMTLAAKKENRKAVGGVMFTAALTSIITGITEPIEFAFIFVAPMLFGVHILLAFISGFLINLFQIRLGYTFTSSLIDFFIGYFNAGNPLKLFYIVGPIIGILYFVSFYFLIKKFDLLTPGRGEIIETAKEKISVSEKAFEVLKALGGSNNIKAIDACITRLRLEVNNVDKVRKKRLKELGSAGIMDAGGGSIQVVFGTEAEGLKDEIKALMSSGEVKHIIIKDEKDNTKKEKHKIKDFNGVKEDIIYSPIKGKVLPITEVPDETFATKILGDGIAIEPSEGIVYSPVEGTVVQVFRTGHAIGIKSKGGTEILIHVGIDTVNMKGEGFKTFVSKGEEVKIGDKLIEVDLELVKEKAKSTITPVIITNTPNVKEIEKVYTGNVHNSSKIMQIKL